MLAGCRWIVLVGFLALGASPAAPYPEHDERRAAAALEQGRKHMNSGRVGAAVNVFEGVVRRHPLTPSAAAAQWEIAGLYARNREPRRAFQQYQKLVDDYPDSPYHERALGAQMEILRGVVDAHRRRLDSGEGAKKSGANSPSTSEIKSMLRQLIASGRHADVAPEAQFALATVLEADGSRKTAKRVHEEFLDRYGKHELADDATFQIAYIEYKNVRAGDIRRAGWADLHFADFIARYPDSPKVPVAHYCRDQLKRFEADQLREVAAGYLASGKPAAALIHLDRLAERFPWMLESDPALAEEIEAVRLAAAEAEGADQ